MRLFQSEADRKNSQERILYLLHALMNCDRIYLRNNPDTPLIYQAGIKYKLPAQMDDADVPEVNTLREYLRETGAPPSVTAAIEALSHMTGGGETFREIPRIIENGGGDCDNVAAWRAAELRELGILAQPMITWRRRPGGGMTYHVLVHWPDGTSEDPSLLLGMGGAERAAERLEEERKNRERTADFIAHLAAVPRLSTVEDVNRASDDVLGSGRLVERLPTTLSAQGASLSA